MARKAKAKQVEEVREHVEEVMRVSQVGAFVVYAEFDGYKPGDVFSLPEGWSVDADYTELLLTKAKKRDGVTFLKPDGGRATLPVKEA